MSNICNSGSFHRQKKPHQTGTFNGAWPKRKSPRATLFPPLRDLGASAPQERCHSRARCRHSTFLPWCANPPGWKPPPCYRFLMWLAEEEWGWWTEGKKKPWGASGTSSCRGKQKVWVTRPLQTNATPRPQTDNSASDDVTGRNRSPTHTHAHTHTRFLTLLCLSSSSELTVGCRQDSMGPQISLSLSVSLRLCLYSSSRLNQLIPPVLPLWG